MVMPIAFVLAQRPVLFASIVWIGPSITSAQNQCHCLRYLSFSSLHCCGALCCIIRKRPIFHSMLYSGSKGSCCDLLTLMQSLMLHLEYPLHVSTAEGLQLSVSTHTYIQIRQTVHSTLAVKGRSCLISFWRSETSFRVFCYPFMVTRLLMSVCSETLGRFLRSQPLSNCIKGRVLLWRSIDQAAQCLLIYHAWGY